MTSAERLAAWIDNFIDRVGRITAWSSFALALDSLLTQRGARWNALLPLAAPVKAGVPTDVPVAAVRRALAAAGESNAQCVEL